MFTSARVPPGEEKETPVSSLGRFRCSDTACTRGQWRRNETLRACDRGSPCCARQGARPDPALGVFVNSSWVCDGKQLRGVDSKQRGSAGVPTLSVTPEGGRGRAPSAP